MLIVYTDNNATGAERLSMCGEDCLLSGYTVVCASVGGEVTMADSLSPGRHSSQHYGLLLRLRRVLSTLRLRHGVTLLAERSGCICHH